MKKIIALLGLVASLAFGSATIISGSSQIVTFGSNPEGAKVKVDGLVVGVTPCSVNLPKSGKAKSISFEKDGMQTITIPMTNQYNGVALLNIFWDLSTTDLITGAAWNYEPNNYFVELTPKAK